MSAKGHLTSQLLAGIPTTLFSAPHPCKQTAPSHLTVKDSRHQELTLHFDAQYHKGLIPEQAAQFFVSRLNLTPLVTMPIFCYLTKFIWIMLPQLFQRITCSSSSIPHSVSHFPGSCKGNKQPT